MKTANPYRYTSKKTGVKGVPITLTVLLKFNCMYWENGPNFVMTFFLYFSKSQGFQVTLLEINGPKQLIKSGDDHAMIAPQIKKLII